MWTKKLTRDQFTAWAVWRGGVVREREGQMKTVFAQRLKGQKDEHHKRSTSLLLKMSAHFFLRRQSAAWRQWCLATFDHRTREESAAAAAALATAQRERQLAALLSLLLQREAAYKRLAWRSWDAATVLLRQQQAERASQRQLDAARRELLMRSVWPPARVSTRCRRLRIACGGGTNGPPLTRGKHTLSVVKPHPPPRLLHTQHTSRAWRRVRRGGTTPPLHHTPDT